VPSKAVIVTGGEPMLYNMNKLCSLLKEKGIRTFLETSGSSPLSGVWDWICLSPKENLPALSEFYQVAGELKMIVCHENDFERAEYHASKVNAKCRLYLQPEWSERKRLTPYIVDYIKRNPKWKISQQTHKYIDIR
jgi:organic radical activating enzyme